MESVQIEIFGQVYTIKGKEDPAYIRELAGFIDAKMREIQRGTGTIDPHRVAILTALTITDELFKVRRQYGSLEKTADKVTKRILDLTKKSA